VRPRSVPTATLLTTLLAVATLAAGCGAGGTSEGAPSSSALAPTTTGAERDTSTTADAVGEGKLSKTEACERFKALAAQYTMSDEESAAAFRALAGLTTDPALALEIRRVGDRFAHHDDAVPADAVLAACEGS
jgi:hypothetical protein